MVRGNNSVKLGGCCTVLVNAVALHCIFEKPNVYL